MNKNLSVFVIKDNEIKNEFHDLSQFLAYKIATDNLYKDEQIVSGVKVVIRDSEKIWFSASNPVIKSVDII